MTNTKAPKHVDARGGVCGWKDAAGTACHQPLAWGQCLGPDGVSHGQRHGLPRFMPSRPAVTAGSYVMPDITVPPGFVPPYAALVPKA